MNPRPLESDPFSEFNCLPLGFYLDPEAWQVEAFRSRASVRHFRRLIATSRFADSFAAQLSRGTWGEEHQGGWSTLVAGKKRETRFKVETIKPLSAEVLLKAFTRMDRFGVGTRDRFEPSWLSVSPDAERAHISNIRFDIDMDSVFENENLSRLTEAVCACREVGDLMQLPSSVMTTGRRGVQAHYALPVRLRTEDARIVRNALRQHLVSMLPNWATLDKDSVDHLLRLPLTRHIKTSRLALYLGSSGLVLPIEQQITAALRAVTPTGSETLTELMDRVAVMMRETQLVTRTKSATASESQHSGATFRGPKNSGWSRLINEPLIAGKTWEYLVERKGVYAHVTRFGKVAATKALCEKVHAMPCDGKLAERLAKVTKLVASFELLESDLWEDIDVSLTVEEGRKVEAYVQEMRTAKTRKDCISRQSKVYAGWLVGERLYGLQISGSRIARIVERLYGAGAPKGKSIYRALDMLREKNKIWFVTLKRDEVSKRISGGYLIPQDLG